jgi:hypothetical protein
MADIALIKSTAEQLRHQLATLDRLTGKAGERSRDVDRKRQKRQEQKLIIVPQCENRSRREELEADDVAWLMHYFGPASEVKDPFTYEFTSQQRQIIEDFRNAIIYGGDQAEAASRGEGKTTIIERLDTKYTLQGVLSYSVLFQATGALADNSLDSIKTAIEENLLLRADYPEVCVPVAALENTPNRAHYQLVNGFRHDNGEPFEMAPSRFTWCGQEIIFPKVPGSPSAGSIIATRGLDAAVRGLKKRGRRPQLAVIDDPDTEETARSEDQSTKLANRIDKTIAGLGGQKKPIARILLCTIQSRTAVAYRFTDPQLKPSWRGRRFRFLVEKPVRTDLWDDYVSQVQADWRGGTALAEKMYLDNRDEMDRGAVVANPNRYAPWEHSAIQHYYNLVARLGQDAVDTEYQNDPPPESDEDLLILTAYHIQENCVSRWPRRVVPDGTVAITIGADVQKLGLHWVAIAWQPNGAGFVIDYDFWEFMTAGRKAADCEVLILEGLLAWHEAMIAKPFVSSSDEAESFLADLTLIDTGYRDKMWNTQPVQVFCSQVGVKFMAAKGQPNYSRPRERRIRTGDNWHIARDGRSKVVVTNADHWKLKVHEGFLADADQPGSLRLFAKPRIHGRVHRQSHLSFAKHITSESWDNKKLCWSEPTKANHYFDATYQAIVGRSICGIHCVPQAVGKPIPPPAERPTAAQLAKR